MNINTLDLNLLRVFAALYHERNVSRAAGRLALTQPAVSNALMRLRRACDDPLFVRTRSGMAPTTLAESLAEPILKAMDTLERGLGRPAGFDPSTSVRTFRLLMSDVGEGMILPSLLSVLQQTAPGIGIEAIRLPHASYSEALEQGQTDLAIGNLTMLHQGFYQQRVLEDRYFCVVQKGSRPSDEPLSLREFLDRRHVVTEAGNADTLVDAALSARRAKRKVALRVTHYHIVADVVARTSLMAVLPEHAIRDPGSIQALPPPFPIPTADVRQFWHSRFHTDPANRWLRSIIAALPLDRSL